MNISMLVSGTLPVAQARADRLDDMMEVSYEPFFTALWVVFYSGMLLPALALVVLGWLLHRGADDFFSLERFWVKYYSNRVTESRTGPDEETTYHAFAKNRGGWMMLAGAAWLLLAYFGLRV